MKKFILLFLISLRVIAQTGIGTSTPDASAKLEVSATNKGFLPPRVALSATNSASPITSPANGLMVFNTATAGASPFNVLPGYYYWDGTGGKWVSLSTTVGNVQNQAIFRSTSNTALNSAVSSWNSRFNNIAAGDLTINANTSFALANGIYKIEWALPYQSSSTYNIIQLQENMSGTWNALLNDAGYSTLGNGGNTDWGGGTFAADIVDCSSSTRMFRFFNLDVYRQLYYGATVIITKLNPSITTSTTADNLGNHTATSNIQLNGKYLSGDGGNEGISVDNTGKVGLGTTSPSTALHIQNGNSLGAGDPATNTVPSIYLFNSNNASNTAHSIMGIRTSGDGGGNPYLSFDISGVRGYSLGIDNADGDKFKIHNNWNFNNTSTPVLTISSDARLGIGTSSPVRKMHLQSADDVSLYIESTTADNNGMVILNGNTGSNWANNYHEFMMFQKQGTNIGNIQGTNGGTQVAYNTSSDYRLKTDFRNYNGLALVNQIKTYDYAWKVNNTRMFGVKAHELQEVIPYMVSGEKDAVDEKGRIKPQSVDYSKLTPILVKAIQEQDVKIQLLEKEKDALELRIRKLEELIQSKEK
ncbi:tail fiber domain-containing protein [Aquirufa regiilacus]|uniref:Tail fiber domain-containing protein n=1 Tax=Aquirufa regiilacus TaxID=3024868 RepID=A0ABU3TR20_9BACT|nr:MULTISPECIES: tail fiber domain-containing protein [unclassified Aquirufa]MDT8886732.1 tail fiber domain-containing protein [Aquirufa sp. LEPPI-3A]MDU0808303.1 tail fiber domain-containing protein [Aquirufa sp. LEOWEIH-7C]